VPPAADLLAGAWTYCVHPATPGDAVVDFAPGPAAAPVPAGDRVLVSGPGGAYSVIWQGVRYPVPEQSALIALGLGTTEPVRVPAAWLGGLPSGPPLTAASVPAAGTAGSVIGGQDTRVGDPLVVTAAGAEQYYIVWSDGLAPASATEAALLSAAENRPVRRVSPGDIASVPLSADRSLENALPDLLDGTDFPATGEALCLLQRADGSTVTSTVATEGGAAAAAGSRVMLPGGAGVLAEAPPAAGQAGAEVSLITDEGERFPIGDEQATSALGYGGVTPRVLPGYLLDLIPPGSTLTVARATAVASGGA